MIDTSLRGRVTSILVGGGYPDYAVRLGGFKEVVELQPGSELLAYTNGTDLFLPGYLSDAEVGFLARHEMLHVLLAHSERETPDRNPLYWNMACDYEASNYYSAHDDKMMRASAQLRYGCSVAFEPQYGDMTAEEIYDALMREAGNTGETGGDSGDARAKAFKAGGFMDVSGESQRELRERMEELGSAALTAQENDTKAATGVSLGGSERDTEPPDPASLDLVYDLRAFFKRDRQVQKGRTFRRPNKKYVDSGIIVRARSNKYTEGSALAVYVDVSASMTREKVAKALGVLRTARKLKRVTLLEFYFSDRVRDIFFEGSGTNYDAVFRHAMQNKYSCIAIITDDSEASLSRSYTFDAVWIAGVEYGDADSYGVGRCINRGKSRGKHDAGGRSVAAQHLKVSVVGS